MWGCPVQFKLMSRYIARFLIVFVLTGTLVPVGLGAVTPTSASSTCPCCRGKHCNCLRMQHEDESQTRISPRTCINGHCFNPLTVPNWAERTDLPQTDAALPAAELQTEFVSLPFKQLANPAAAVRGPPTSSLA